MNKGARRGVHQKLGFPGKKSELRCIFDNFCLQKWRFGKFEFYWLWLTVDKNTTLWLWMSAWLTSHTAGLVELDAFRHPVMSPHGSISEGLARKTNQRPDWFINVGQYAISCSSFCSLSTGFYVAADGRESGKSFKLGPIYIVVLDYEIVLSLNCTRLLDLFGLFSFLGVFFSFICKLQRRNELRCKLAAR